MRKEIQKVKELTSKPFGINIFHSGQNPDVQLELMLKVVYEEKVPVAVVVHDSLRYNQRIEDPWCDSCISSN